MSDSVSIFKPIKRCYATYTAWLKWFVKVLAFVAGLGVLAMMTVTFLDVVLRIFGVPIIGAFDIVRIAGTIAIATALPYTTAVKGHVAIEYFFQKLSKRWRVVVDTLARLLSMSLFALLTWHSIKYGTSLRASGEVSATLQIPMFWVPYIIAFSCAVTVLVVIHHLFHPGKELIAP